MSDTGTDQRHRSAMARLWVVPLAVACLVLAACLGGGGGPGAAPQSPATVVPAAGTLSISPRAAQVIDGVNAQRSAAGLGPVSAQGALTMAAEGHAQDMAARGTLTHTGSDGSDITDRVLRTGYRFRTVAENVAVGQSSPAEVVVDWMNSSGHRANILNPAVRDIGVGYAEGQPAGGAPGRYWVIVLGG